MRSDDGQLNEIERLREELANTRAKLDTAWQVSLSHDICTPAERKVLEAWGSAPEVALRAVSSMPKHLFGWLLPACEAELARRGEKP